MSSTPTQSADYVGNELALFRHACNWKRYSLGQLRSFVHGDVLEVGAGIGGSTMHLFNDAVTRWHALEPDGALAEQIRHSIRIGELPEYVNVDSAFTHELLADENRASYDSILYIDVIEHIEDDRAELEVARQLLKPGGRLIILVPAHQSLYSAFDKAIGHYRRYDRKMLKAVIPEGFTQEKLRYLDSVGTLLSLANRLLLRSGQPTPRQIAFWDRIIVPISRVLDPLTGHRIGKTLIGVWRKAE